MSAAGVRLYNTMTQRVEALDPIEPGHVRFYVCGLTTYDHAHAGHARTFVAFDVLVRFLRARGLRVTYVRNVTDVDDKIVRRALENGEPPLALSERMARVNAQELRACGCMDPDAEPKVSESVPAIVALIERLVADGAAYVAETPKGRDVYFAVRAFPAYGKLSHRNVDDLVSGARVEPGDAKRDPLDFALWKGDGASDFGWDSPWGRGRPGWHIECSAMAAEALSPHFDIHGGGMDLIFPHHENEIAQSEAAWGEPFSRIWMHAGFVQVDAEKMSKSLGNFVTIQQIIDRNDGEALRYFLLGAHYRVPVEFDVEKRDDGRVVFPGVEEAERRVDYLYATRETLMTTADGAKPAIEGDGPQAKVIRGAVGRVMAALDNDLNTSVALSVIAELAPAANEVAVQATRAKKDPKALAKLQALAAAALEALEACCRPVGLLQTPAPIYFARTKDRRLRLRGLDAANIDAKVRERAAARAQKDFARADAIRAELTATGIEVQDVTGTDRSLWRVLV
ncbi:MAG TPA: cysteine--tRNA ligase [Polyangiaceae bacterium]|nr:cysteine--tRNA ligase [Polyangiaceae bacterium]